MIRLFARNKIKVGTGALALFFALGWFVATRPEPDLFQGAAIIDPRFKSQFTASRCFCGGITAAWPAWIGCD
jgi:hypothetical protein